MRIDREVIRQTRTYSALLIMVVGLFGVIALLIEDAGAFGPERSIAFSQLRSCAQRLIPEIRNGELSEAGRETLGHFAMEGPVEFISSAEFSESPGPTLLDSEEFRMAGEKGEGWHPRGEPASSLVLVQSLRVDEKLIGFLRTEISLADALSRSESVRGSLLIGGALVLFLGIIGTFFLAKHQAASVERLRDYIVSLAAGAHEERPPILSSWELNECVRALKDIAAELMARIQKGARNKKELETILASMGEGLMAVDLDHKIILMNEAAKKILGVEAHGEIPSTTEQLSSGPLIQEQIDSAISSGTLVSAQLEFESVGLWVELQIAPLRDEMKSTKGAVCLLSDVSTIHRLENMRREFVANVSHELKTPLTAIQGAAETIQGDPSMPAEVRERFVGRIVQNAMRLDGLINDVLELSRLQAGDEHLNMEPLELGALARESVSLLTMASQTEGVSLELVEPIEDVRVLGDRRALKSVFDNLILNALKYTPAGGRVQVALTKTNGCVTFMVKDDGEGIAAEHQDRIFERFYRVDAARSRQVGGTGLGLAIVKNCVIAHGGRIELDSTCGKGSTFFVSLPQVS